jgi:hypothetical protein
MAVRRVILSSASPSQNLASSLLDFANNDSLSIGEINRSRKQTESTIKPLGLSWTGDFDSLKYFVAESLKLTGTWSQPGGDKKVFVAEDASIVWRKNKSILTIEGLKANQLKREVCRYICDCSSESSHASTEIEDLKQGQQSNEEAIQALSDTISHMGAVVSRFQVFMDKNNKSIGEKKSNRSAEYKNLHAGHVNEMAEMRGHHANDAEGNKSLNTEQLASITINDCDNSLLPNITLASCDAELIGNKGQNMQTIDNLHAVNSSSNDESVQVTAVGYDNTYAKVAARRSPAIACQRIEAPNENILINQELPIDVDDGFKGVERKRNRIKRFFLTGIDECVEEKHIRAYLERRNIKPTHISIFKSRREGTVSAKLNIRTVDAKLVTVEKFWPMFVKCKQWQSSENKRSAERGSNTTLKGNNSTYV